MTSISNRTYLWPCPVYVAQLANGASTRVAVMQKRGKPWDFAQGRRIAASRMFHHLAPVPMTASDAAELVAQNAQRPDWADPMVPPGHKAYSLWEAFSYAEVRALYQHPVTAGLLFWQGEAIPDPHFSDAPIAVAKPPPSEAARLLRRAAQLVGADVAAARALALQALELTAAA